MKKRALLVLSLCIGIALLLGGCGPDRQLGYQAVLTGPGGIPVANGNYTVLVKFWNDPTATADANMIYSDDQTVVVSNGMLNIAIPDLVTEGDNLDPADFARPLWVELTINGETLSPRQKLLGTPYAYTLVGGAIVTLEDAQKGPIVANFPQRGVLTIGNSVLNNTDAGSPGATGLVVTIADSSDSEVIRACAGGLSTASGCTDTYLVFRVSGDGDVSQNNTGDGLVKAGVYANCHNAGSSISRSFNNGATTAVTIANGSAGGRCTLDFGFDISNRYWVSSAAILNTPRSVVCFLNAGSNNKLDCFRFDEIGVGKGGFINVILY